MLARSTVALMSIQFSIAPRFITILIEQQQLSCRMRILHETFACDLSMNEGYCTHASVYSNRDKWRLDVPLYDGARNPLLL